MELIKKILEFFLGNPEISEKEIIAEVKKVRAKRTVAKKITKKKMGKGVKNG